MNETWFVRVLAIVCAVLGEHGAQGTGGGGRYASPAAGERELNVVRCGRLLCRRRVREGCSERVSGWKRRKVAYVDAIYVANSVHQAAVAVVDAHSPCERYGHCRPRPWTTTTMSTIRPVGPTVARKAATTAKALKLEMPPPPPIVPPPQPMLTEELAAMQSALQVRFLIILALFTDQNVDFSCQGWRNIQIPGRRVQGVRFFAPASCASRSRAYTTAASRNMRPQALGAQQLHFIAR